MAYEHILQILFYLLSVTGLIYFTATPRTIDGLSMAYGATIVYFMPGFFGYTLEKNNELQITSGCYHVMLLVLASMLFTAMFIDNYGKRYSNINKGITSTPYWILLIPLSLTIIDISGMIYVISSSGSLLFSTNKNEMYSSFGRGHLIWLMGAPTALIACVTFKRWSLSLINLISLLFMLYTGSRSQLAVGILGSLFVILSRRGPVPLIRSRKTVIALLLFSAFIFLYKQCYIAIKMGDYEAVSSRISDRWYVAFAESEPFMIQHTLNSVIIEDYSIHAPSHLTGSVLANFDFSGSYKAREYSFGDIATYDLFGDVGYGMASNIWAEYYSCGGLIGVAIFLFFYIISLCSFRLDRYSPFYMCIASGWIPWWVFYIHRNDTFRMVSFAKQYGFILLCGIILAFFLSLLASTPVRPASRGSRLR